VARHTSVIDFCEALPHIRDIVISLGPVQLPAILAHTVVDLAKLKPVERNGSTRSSRDFWVSAHLSSNKKTLLDLDSAGYQGSRGELEYAKPQAAVTLVVEAVQGLDFKAHSLTDEERGWASAKFARDSKGG